MNIQTYTQKSNARRAAIAALKKEGLTPEGNFEVKQQGKKFIWIKTLCNNEELATDSHNVLVDQTGMPVFNRKAVKAPVKAPTKAPETKGLRKAPRERINGIARPGEGTICASIWAQCDGLAAETGKTPQYKEIKAWAESAAVDKTTAKVQYYCWRKYNGIKGRV